MKQSALTDCMQFYITNNLKDKDIEVLDIKYEYQTCNKRSRLYLNIRFVYEDKLFNFEGSFYPTLNTNIKLPKTSIEGLQKICKKRRHNAYVSTEYEIYQESNPRNVYEFKDKDLAFSISFQCDMANQVILNIVEYVEKEYYKVKIKEYC